MNGREISSHNNKAAVVIFIVCMLMAFVRETSHIQLMYGLSFSLTSFFILLGLRYCGYIPTLLGAALICSISVFFLDRPLLIYVSLLEVAIVGLSFKKFRNRLFVIDAAFWLILGMPIIYAIYRTSDLYSTMDAVLIACMLAWNGLFNALFAEIIDQYAPLPYKDGNGKRMHRPSSIRSILFHSALAVVFIGSIFNFFLSSFSAVQESNSKETQLAEGRYASIIREWNRTQIENPIRSEEEQLLQLHKLLTQQSVSDGLIFVQSDNGTLLAANDPIATKALLAQLQASNTQQIKDRLHLAIPKQQSQRWMHTTWHGSHWLYEKQLPMTDWFIVIEKPIAYNQHYLFTKYTTHFMYAISFMLLAILLAQLVSVWITRSLTRLATTTRNLPLKLKQMKPIVWSNTSIVEIHSLITNFKHMSSSLVHMFNETQKNNERLQAQAHMLQQSEERLQQLAYFDQLTGLPNRLQFTQHFQSILSLQLPASKQIAILIADINRFKQMNDTLGYTVGNTLLMQAAQRFEAAAGKNFNVFRAGGDEFLFIAPFEEIAELNQVAQSICDTFEQPFVIDQVQLFLTVSVGISIYLQDGQHIDTILQNAEIAMYNAKEEGDGCYRYFQPQLISVLTERMQLENGLYHALHDEQLALYYQPKMNALTGELSGIEALIRWFHPELGMIPPDKFIPLAEQSGFILEIDRWVFREACRQNKAWQDAGHRKVCVSVNISAKHFYQGNLKDMIIETLEETGLAAEYVSIEITEGVFMKNMDQVLETIHFLRTLGIQISIDDFGTGYSSLNQLQRLPISDVKLDRSFIQGITNDEKKSSIVRAIIELVHSMNMKVVAEGVETAAESSFCKALKCDELQGYYFSKPLPPQQLEALLSSQGMPTHNKQEASFKTSY